MDRQFAHYGAIPLDTDFLRVGRYAMIGLGKLAEAVLGTGTWVNGLNCTPTGTPSMAVLISKGEVYSLENVDDSAFGRLTADTDNQIVKQGLVMTDTTLNVVAPTTPGQSRNYLVQARYSDVDGGATVLPYYNAADPSQPFSGPNNAGTANSTVRQGVCVLDIKAGVAATSGSQVTPSPDAGWVGLWVVTVAYGQSTVTGNDIARYTAEGWPWIEPITSGVLPLRRSIPLLLGYGVTPATLGTVGDTPITAFAASETQSVYFGFAVDSTFHPDKPVKLLIHYTGDAAGNNFVVRLGYQAFDDGNALGAASYTNNQEIIPGPDVAGDLASATTATAIIPASEIVPGKWINCTFSRLPLDGSDTNTGVLQVLNITLVQ